ncbi:hypothetical protein Bbelb_192490 [Branchiostoma belcheri]|nr:hypothetical protein Bbelb_192490 [Branchiostoma belcheri]
MVEECVCVGVECAIDPSPWTKHQLPRSYKSSQHSLLSESFLKGNSAAIELWRCNLGKHATLPGQTPAGRFAKMTIACTRVVCPTHEWSHHAARPVLVRIDPRFYQRGGSLIRKVFIFCQLYRRAWSTVCSFFSGAERRNSPIFLVIRARRDGQRRGIGVMTSDHARLAQLRSPAVRTAGGDVIARSTVLGEGGPTSVRGKLEPNVQFSRSVASLQGSCSVTQAQIEGEEVCVMDQWLLADNLLDRNDNRTRKQRLREMELRSVRSLHPSSPAHRYGNAPLSTAGPEGRVRRWGDSAGSRRGFTNKMIRSPKENTVSEGRKVDNESG